MKKHIVTFCIVLFSTVMLGGCGSRTTLEPITFEGFTLGIPEDFESVPSGLVENKQIINKVVRAYKLVNPTGYDKNIVISRSSIRPGVRYDEFATANSQRLLKELVGFQSGSRERFSVSCNSVQGGVLEGVIHSFRVADTFYKTSPEYFIHQFQFVTDDSGYIISFATDEEKEEKLFKTIIKSLECSDSEE